MKKAMIDYMKNVKNDELYTPEYAIKPLLNYINEYNIIEEQEDLKTIMNLQEENEKLENDKRGMLVQLYKANQRSEYLQRSCERKEEQMLDYRQEYMEQEDYKSRIDKAIEYINEICLCSDGYANYGDDLRPEHIVDILQGNEGE